MDWENRATKTPDIATTDPTDKSIPPVKITNSMPMLIIPTGADCLIKLDRLLAVKKAFDTEAETISMIRKIKIVLCLIMN